jgi:hypothetical protein
MFFVTIYIGDNYCRLSVKYVSSSIGNSFKDTALIIHVICNLHLKLIILGSGGGWVRDIVIVYGGGGVFFIYGGGGGVRGGKLFFFIGAVIFKYNFRLLIIIYEILQFDLLVYFL